MSTPDPKQWFADCWRRVRAQLRVEMEARHFEFWIAPLHVLSADPESIVIACQTDFMRDKTVEKFGQRITDMIAARVPKLSRVEFVVDPAPKSPPARPHAVCAAKPAIHGISGGTEPVAPTHDASEPAHGEPRMLVESIKRTVAAHYDVSVGDLESPSRKRAHVRPRQMAMHVARKLTGRSYPDIAMRFGGRDHTTVIHGCRKMERQIASDPILAAEFEAVMRRCTS